MRRDGKWGGDEAKLCGCLAVCLAACVWCCVFVRRWNFLLLCLILGRRTMLPEREKMRKVRPCHNLTVVGFALVPTQKIAF